MSRTAPTPSICVGGWKWGSSTPVLPRCRCGAVSTCLSAAAAIGAAAPGHLGTAVGHVDMADGGGSGHCKGTGLPISIDFDWDPIWLNAGLNVNAMRHASLLPASAPLTT